MFVPLQPHMGEHTLHVSLLWNCSLQAILVSMVLRHFWRLLSSFYPSPLPSKNNLCPNPLNQSYIQGTFTQNNKLPILSVSSFKMKLVTVVFGGGIILSELNLHLLVKH